jgi:hypothetical protein
MKAIRLLEDLVVSDPSESWREHWPMEEILEVINELRAIALGDLADGLEELKRVRESLGLPASLPDPCHDGSYPPDPILRLSTDGNVLAPRPSAFASSSPTHSSYWCTRCAQTHPSGTAHT